MSDWNTLHLFNDKLFYSEVVPDFKGEGTLLKHYFDSQLGKYILWNNSRSDERIDKILSYCKFLDADFKVHETLHEIQSRKKNINEDYSTFTNRQSEAQDDFFRSNADVIDDIQNILLLIVFSECAAFNPHLILGRRIFIGNVSAKPRSIAEEVIAMFTNSEFGYTNQMGIINWVRSEDLKLLLLDRNNLYPSRDESEGYFSEFIKFMEIAVANNLGVISISNVNERVLNMIETPKVQIEIDVECFEFKSVIKFG